ncbi:MAG: hypothetical protein HeimC2_42830 [Candidatus Heimdallarchaeota archaeon LC_2]|nr:MAG: hypothetical protein HeimC2_42830 [Candidatus Heimdallarchaeota archaeon LC_2]
MSAYLIADITISDPNKYSEYLKFVGATLTKFGGKLVIAVGEHSRGKIEVIEGNWNPKHLVMVEFEHLDLIKKWYSSSEYQEILNLRNESSQANFIAVENEITT